MTGSALQGPWSPEALRALQENYREERSNGWIYRSLAEGDPNPTRSATLRTLADFADRHAEQWGGLLDALGQPRPSVSRHLDHRLLAVIARGFGVGMVLPVLHRQDVDGVSRYRDQARRWQDPRAQKLFETLLPDEVAHEVDTFNSARRSRPKAAASLRSLLLGAIDGFASLVALCAGVAGITGSSRTVIIAGVASLIAGSLSMAGSQYVSVRAEGDVRSAEVHMERAAIDAAPMAKRRQLAESFRERGLQEEEADRVVDRLAATPEGLLRALLHERFGPTELGGSGAVRQGLLTGLSFAIAGALPLVPYFFLSAHPGTLVAVVVTGVALFVAGLFRALSSLQPFLRSGLEMVFVGMGAAAVAYLLGLAIGGVVAG